MCTVSFIPLTSDSFVFTSNRDEDPVRAATGLHKLVLGDKSIYYPQDTQAKGSWFVFSNTNQLVCILNGAFDPHLSDGTYKMSRGKMALKFFEYKDYQTFVNNFEFEGMEPFTFIIFDQGILVELRWDELKLHIKELSNSEIHLWSSSTLYPASWQIDRQEQLIKWLSQGVRSQEEVMDFHKVEFPFKRDSLVEIYRSGVPEELPVETLSVSSIKGNQVIFDFKYKRVKTLVNFQKSIQIKGA
tara:strand:- start:12030 stop:12758 length:729 start_codon:yes stop_codon:yes gene_type:complete